MKASPDLLAALLLGAVAISSIRGRAATPDFLWLRTGRGGGPDISTGIWSDAAGNNYTVGVFSSSNLNLGGGVVLTNAVHQDNVTKDIFVVKYSANGTLVWAKRIGGTDGDDASGIAFDAQQNFYLAGTFGTDLPLDGFTLTNHSAPGSAGLFVARFDAQGNSLWARGADSGKGQSAAAAAVDGAGACYVTGTLTGTNQFGSYTLVSQGDQNVLLVKYDASGNLLWARQAGGSYRDSGAAVVADAAGNCFLLATIRSPNAAFGGFVFATTGTTDADIVIAKYDPDGNVVWAKQYGGTGIDSATAIALDSAGNIFITGSYRSTDIIFGGDALTNFSSVFPSTEFFLAKLDPGGNALWARAAHGNSSEGGSSMAVDFAGDSYVAGFFTSTNLVYDTLTLTNSESESGPFTFNDAFIAKFDPNGNLLWAAQPIGVDEQRAFGIAVDASANAYVTGWTQGANVQFGSFATTNTYLDLFVAKLESDYPVLEVDLVDTNALVSWSAKQTGFLLESSTNLQDWVPAPGPIGTANGRHIATNSGAGDRAFFRLKK